MTLLIRDIVRFLAFSSIYKNGISIICTYDLISYSVHYFHNLVNNVNALTRYFGNDNFQYIDRLSLPMNGARSNVCYYFNAYHRTLVRMTNWLLHVVKTSASDSREMLAGVISDSIIFDHTRFMRIRSIVNIRYYYVARSFLAVNFETVGHISSESSAEHFSKEISI